MTTELSQYRYWRRAGCRGVLRAGRLDESLLVDWLNDRWPAACELLKSEARRATRRVEIDGQLLLVKQYRDRPLLPARAAAVHRTTLRLQQLGVSVPPSLGYARGVGHSIQVAQWLEGATPLLSFAGKPGAGEKLAPAIEGLLAQVAAMHAAGLVHGDLKWGNILRRGNETWLVDLDSVSRARPGRSGARDLARFLVDCEEAGCSADFVHRVQAVYGEQRGWDPARVRRWIAADYRKITERHRRRYGAGHRL
ncbi:lipopolysaccharide kinase InaA family protein [Microbulbifer sp.]|uniref:lipopolysaccharide kinase InaA family protein n=1 Tax=Microbulbifer sp. TaxID=1908541 RepID=UPI003F344641